MTAETDLLPLPPLGECSEDSVQEWGRANVEAHTEALRAEAARLRRSLHEAVVHGNRQSGRAERLAEALRGIETKLVHSMDHARSSLERKRAMSECADAARAALEQETTND